VEFCRQHLVSNIKMLSIDMLDGSLKVLTLTAFEEQTD